jgi:hypothetical protein
MELIDQLRTQDIWPDGVTVILAVVLASALLVVRQFKP